MMDQKRLRDYGISIGYLKTGKLNAITDVTGIKAGHSTIDDGAVKTGVTAILPHEGNLFREKVPAACHVINGFGKTTGLIQINEMGTIETPIILTNTLSVGTAYDTVVEYMLERNSDIGREGPTVNPVICECNDGYLNDIRGRFVRKENIFDAIFSCDREFEEGAAGAGTGMSCYQLKGGIGTSSRIISAGENNFTLGALVLTNFGVLKDLSVNGIPVGRNLEELQGKSSAGMRCEELHCLSNTGYYERAQDKGSIIVIVATDIPLSERQLGRVARRSANGIARTGSYMGSGSGEICIAFSTSNRVFSDSKEYISKIIAFNELYMDDVFRAVVESVEEAVLNSLVCARSITGRDGNTRRSLCELMELEKLRIII